MKPTPTGEFLEFRSIVKYQIPILDDGTLGNPMIVQKWTVHDKKTKTYNKVIKPPVELLAEEEEKVTL